MDFIFLGLLVYGDVGMCYGFVCLGVLYGGVKEKEVCINN